MSYFLTQCAHMCERETEIDYKTMMRVGEGSSLGKLMAVVGELVDKIVRRQAVLQALGDENLTGEAVTYLGNFPLSSYVTTGFEMRVAHSGGEPDPKLPQGPYDSSKDFGQPGGPPEQASPNSTSLRHRANWT